MNLQSGTRNVRRTETGFTLIEVLLAVALFAIGMLALAGMFAGQMVGHAMGRNTTEATAAAQERLEQIYRLPYANVDAQNGVTQDCRFGAQGWDCGALVGGGCPSPVRPYRRQSTVTPEPAGFPAGTRLIAVTVQWCDDIGASHSITVSGTRIPGY